MWVRVACAVYKLKILNNFSDIFKPWAFHLWKSNSIYLMVWPYDCMA